ncbi:hypothetical protein Q5P01_002371 [Channa striata]|uniref:Ig-like domain-containing protein n=1 Tax=Channa striata TaxID=64152 RepID=A0AA88P0K8_CHASR|nr:hypothetical protein Q5P01_002371 [Channa striata]
MKVIFKRSNHQFFHLLQPDRSDRWFCSGFVMAVTLLSWQVASCTGETLDNGELEKILAIDGETVILPCHIPVKHDMPTVEWSKEGLSPNIVFLYRDGCETFEMKNPHFRYRTNLILNKLKNGDISLIISNVNLKDAGIYHCVILRGKNPEVIKTLELVVGAVSEPKLRVVSGVGDEVTLECEANCWFPQPVMTFLDDQGNHISAENAKRRDDSRGCFNVTSRVTVQNIRVTCRVHQPLFNMTRETEKYVPDIATCVRSCTVASIITSLVTILMCSFAFLCKKLTSVKRNISGQSSDQSVKSGKAEDVHHQVFNSENVTTDLLQRIKEQEEKLHCKDERIHQLTEELNDLRSREGPALQLDQPTVDHSSCRPSPHVSEPNNYPPPQLLSHGINPKPTDITSKNNPIPGNSSKNKDSKPGVLGENPALDAQVQTSSHNHNSPAPLTNNAAMSSSSSSALMLEEKSLSRSKSLSRPHLNNVMIQRRSTFSAASPKRFSHLKNSSEDLEKLLANDIYGADWKV